MSIYTQKRTIYQAQINNSLSISNDETIIPVLIKNVIQDATKTGNKPGTPYYKLICVCMVKEPTFVKKQVKKAKTDVVDDEVVDDVVDGSPDTKGTVVNGGDEFMVTTYDRAAATISSGLLVKLAMSTDWYQDRYTFRAGKVLVDKSSNILCDKVYDAVVRDTRLSEIPTVENVNRDDFREGLDEKLMNRVFVLPLSGDNSKFANVEIQIEDDATGRFFSKKKEDLLGQYVGVNSIMGDKSSNMFKIVYTQKDEGVSKVMMTIAYMPEVWDCFGCGSVDLWSKVAHRFIFNAVEWYVYGYSNLLRLEGIVGDGDDDGDDGDGETFEYSTGFVTRMNVNLKETIKRIGIPLSVGFIEKSFGEQSGYQNDHEYEIHPLNGPWKVNVRRDKPYVINFTDLSVDQVETFFKEITKNGSKVQFYGIFAEHAPYEMAYGDSSSREEAIIKDKLVPDMVFAINK
jgi:hypothetical protein